jgi:beta-galactosidase/beta-glucuronidase
MPPAAAGMETYMLVDHLSSAPNPQFARPGWRDQNGTWLFRFDDHDVGLAERWYANPDRINGSITVPYPPESPLSGVGDRSYHRVMWYARTLDLGSLAEGEHQLLQFGAVDFRATVWVDGVWVGSHVGGQTPFTCDITDALDPARDCHVAVVRVEDDPVDIEQPRGKQEWLPDLHVIWYHRTSGIWQPVWTETAPAARILYTRWRFDRARWLVDYEIELSQVPEAGSTLSIELEHDGDPLVRLTVTATNRVIVGQLPVNRGGRHIHPKDLLWSVDRPTLIGATLTLNGGAVDDVVQTYLGLRTITLSDRRFRINGRDVFLRFVLNQGYWPESQLAAPSPEALKREVELILELGFNGARNHQKIEDPRFLYWADRLGLLLWGETANSFAFTERSIDWHLDEWRDAVLRDRNHPSVIAWVPFNESWGVDEVGYSEEQQYAVKAAYYRTKMLDGTRPVIGNDGWENVIGDLVTIHDYTWDAQTLRDRYTSEDQLPRTMATHFPGARQIAVGDFCTDGKPVMVTEYGGVTFAPNFGENWFGYGKVESAEEYLAQYKALTNALSASDYICGYCYTQLTDTEQETNGLLTADRFPKLDPAAIRAINRTRAEAVPGESISVIQYASEAILTG